MPNPPTNPNRGPCQTCKGFGGDHVDDPKLGATVCPWSSKSGKRISRMPEIGCSAWERRPADPPPPKPEGPDFSAQFR